MAGRPAKPGAAGGRAPSADLPRLAAQCSSSSGEAVVRATEAIATHLTSGSQSAAVAAAVAARVPRALARLLARDVCDDARASALSAASALCLSRRGAEAFVAAGGLPPTAALLRSSAPAVHGAAVFALLSAAQATGAAAGQLAADARVVDALTLLMRRLPEDGPAGGARPFMAAALLCRLSHEALCATGGAAPTGLCTPVSAAIVRGGGVPLAVGVLRDMLEGGGVPDALRLAEGASILGGLAAWCAGDAAALRAAAGAGALPLVARLLEAREDAERGGLAALANTIAFLGDLARISPAGDVRALASRPALAGALAAALGAAARAGAAAGRRPDDVVQGLVQMTLGLLLTLLAYDEPSSHAVASSFARAGGASHLVRAPAAMPGVLVACKLGHARPCARSLP
jgi:hypothetical protein